MDTPPKTNISLKFDCRKMKFTFKMVPIFRGHLNFRGGGGGTVQKTQDDACGGDSYRGRGYDARAFACLLEGYAPASLIPCTSPYC